MIRPGDLCVVDSQPFVDLWREESTGVRQWGDLRFTRLELAAVVAVVKERRFNRSYLNAYILAPCGAGWAPVEHLRVVPQAR